VRKLSSGKNDSQATYHTFRAFIETRSAEVVANIIICLIHQTNFLLDRQTNSLKTKFFTQGDIREQMTQARREVRKEQKRKSEEVKGSGED
jgi:four helix bundle suffix protein